MIGSRITKAQNPKPKETSAFARLRRDKPSPRHQRAENIEHRTLNIEESPRLDEAGGR